jgi:hypothetical protein
MFNSSSGMNIKSIDVLGEVGTYNSPSHIAVIEYNGNNVGSLTVPSGSYFTLLVSNVSCTSSFSTQLSVLFTSSNGLYYSIQGTVTGSPNPAFTFTLTVPSNAQYFAPLLIDPSSPLPDPFQQMIKVGSSSAIWNYINTSSKYFGQNVFFFYGNGSIIPSWLESYSSNNAIWWIKLNQVPSGNYVIYMGFAPKTTNLFNNVNIGEAPQLSPTYGEYDNGANVFLAYFNMETDPISSSYLGTAHYSIVDGTGPTGETQPLLSWTGATGQDYVFINLKSTLPSNFILITWVKSNANANDIGLGAGSTAAGEWDGYVVDPGAYGNKQFELWIVTGHGFSQIKNLTYSQQANTWYTLEFQYLSGGSMTGWVEPWQNTLDASNSSIKVTGSDTTYKSFNAIELFPYSSSTSDITYWALIVARAYPPNGIMPSVSFGNVA